MLRLDGRVALVTGAASGIGAATATLFAQAGADVVLCWYAGDPHDVGPAAAAVESHGRKALVLEGDVALTPDVERMVADTVAQLGRLDIVVANAAIARDVATECLGPRSPADERRALDREVIRHAPTRLDRMIAQQLPEDRTIRVASLEAANGDPSTTRALKERARELQRMGLASEVKRNVLRFEPGWRDKLHAMELHLDVRKALMQTRAREAARAMTEPARQAIKGLPLTPGRDF